MLEVSNAGGCSSSATIDLCVEDSYAFYAPNAFTANNDGFNDGFMVSTTVRNPEFFELKIFDRWGQQVATINKQLTPWNGDGVPLGVYVWQARVKDSACCEWYNRVNFRLRSSGSEFNHHPKTTPA
ncbi:MAG: gliding motility-associated C-terminal domain-containing protein [Flavobacteriales bacterium]|nr:gliding motility-associated C-terminal domain-containing protein [Flavobacteriales bacterium]